MAHFEVVAEYGSGDLSDQKTIDAICMRLSAGIEALSGLSDADRAALFGDVWNEMSTVCWLAEKPLRPEWEGDEIRDRYELSLVRAFHAAGKPVLGICRGAQLINVAFGGTLYQDIPTQLPQSQVHVTDSYEKHRHEIRFEPGSGLARLYRSVEKPTVTSIHHQSIKTLGRGLRVEAWSEPDGVVEAVRANGKGYVLAVQWHPEFHHPGDAATLDSAPILEEFLEAARGG